MQNNTRRYYIKKCPSLWDVMNVIGVGFPARSQSKFVSLIFLGPLHNLAKVASFFLGKNVRGPFWHSSFGKRDGISTLVYVFFPAFNRKWLATKACMR